MKYITLTTVAFAALLTVSGQTFAACDATSAGENATATECNTDNSTNIHSDNSTNIDNSTNVDNADHSHTVEHRTYGGDHIENPNVVNINKGAMVQQQAVSP